MLVRGGGFLLLVCCILFAARTQAQGLVVVPLEGRAQQPIAFNSHVGVLGQDTLLLPFFDDFTVGVGYPSRNRWTDNQVWVNNTFPTNPPNYNVATFDHLDKNGNPYALILNKKIMVYADSLTSKPIKLDSFKIGVNKYQAYTTNDSIFLSFFYQAKGLGDIPEAEDSLLLFFKNKNGIWKKVWGTTGGTVKAFEMIAVAINDADFLHNGFQFRFVNYTKSTGNLNQWHVDYVRVEKYKGLGNFDLYKIEDIGIVKAPATYLKTYFSLPLHHYKSNTGSLTRDKDDLEIRNLNPSTSAQVRFSRRVYNQYSSTDPVDSFPLSIGQNINSGSNYTFTYLAASNLKIDTFGGSKNPCFDVNHIAVPQSNNSSQAQYNPEGNNDQITTKHCFTPWYAYDDGSAEGGFGLDYAFLGKIQGQFAMKFENMLDDSLRGLSIYFNQSETSVREYGFYLRIWKSLSPIGGPDNADQLIYEKYISKPIYTDSVNHFTYIFFDTVLVLKAGTYYVGWKQNEPFVLNVGYDNNYRYQDQEMGNPNLFYNLLGSWERAGGDYKGVPMIRPMLGTEKDYSFSVKKTAVKGLSVFPNPAAETIGWHYQEPMAKGMVLDMFGRNMAVTFERDRNTINVANLAQGTYVLLLQTESGKLIKTKFIKN